MKTKQYAKSVGKNTPYSIEMEVITISLEMLGAIALFAVPPSLFVIRYFWNKEKCFVALKTKMEELSTHDKDSVDEHDGFEGRLKAIEQRQQKNEIYLKLLLDHNKIKYSD